MTALLALCGLAVGVIIGQVLHDRRHPVVKATGYNPPPPASEPRPEPPPPPPVQQPAEAGPPPAMEAVKTGEDYSKTIPRPVSGPNGHRGKHKRGKRR